MYDKSPGFVECNGEIIDPQFYVGWLNHILGTTFHEKGDIIFGKRQNILLLIDVITISRFREIN